MAILHGDKTFLSIPNPQVSAAQDHRAIESYKAHNDGVRRLIPSKQLLEIDLSDGLGWAPLCEFLLRWSLCISRTDSKNMAKPKQD